MDRTQQLTTWLQHTLNQPFNITTASADASFRRYFRIHLADKSLIAMDAPPSQEDCRPFVKIAALLLQCDLNVPAIIAQDITQGFLLLSDLGDDTYLSKLNTGNAAKLYGDACQALIKMQAVSLNNTSALPLYDKAMLMREMQLLPDWYIQKHLGHTLTAAQQTIIENTFSLLANNILAQPQVTVHRDYHSRNLMLTHDNNPGILDFQDAVHGAITYDLASLFKDAYIQWPEEQVVDWLVRYWQSAKSLSLPVNTDFGEFYKDFEWVGVQRHIKILGIFMRLYYRDGKDAYLKNIPLVKQYLYLACERYTELRPFLRLMQSLNQNA